jgi:hypothetical protein
MDVYIIGHFDAVGAISISLKAIVLVDISIESVEKTSTNEIISTLPNRHVEKPSTHLENGKFAPGNIANPAGRGLGTPNAVQLGGPITQETIDKLETFSKSELIKLIKKVSGAVWGVGIMTDDEAFEAVRLKLLHTGLTSESANSSLNVLKEWADRTKGKAPQSIAMKIDIDPISKLSSDRLMKLEKSLAKMTGQEALVIPPMPELLEDDE